jgi:hypothetical protein
MTPTREQGVLQSSPLVDRTDTLHRNLLTFAMGRLSVEHVIGV